MTLATLERAADPAVRTARLDAFAHDDEKSHADIWTLLESFRSAQMSAQERDAEDERKGEADLPGASLR